MARERGRSVFFLCRWAQNDCETCGILQHVPEFRQKTRIISSYFSGIQAGQQGCTFCVELSLFSASSDAFRTCDVAELYLLVACRSSTRGQGLTFTSARVLARALFRASGYMTLGTPITSRPFGREVPLRSRAPVSCVTATVRITVEEMCGLSLRLTYGHRVRALLVLAPLRT